jgi:hypothetical protein
MSFSMIFFWAFGDSLRLLFLLIEQQPVQFIIGSIVQISIEAFLLGQYFVYHRSKEEENDMTSISWIV